MPSRADYETWRRLQEYRREHPRTWQEFIADFNLTLEEQGELVRYLAYLRQEATIKSLMPVLRSPERPAPEAAELIGRIVSVLGADVFDELAADTLLRDARTFAEAMK